MTEYETLLAGVTFRNSNGTDRQLILQKSLKVRTAEIVREFDNKHDRKAFAAHTKFGQVGYLPKEVAAEIAPDFDAGKTGYKVTEFEVSQSSEGIWLGKVFFEVHELKDVPSNRISKPKPDIQYPDWMS